jgi:glycerate-2-kinase
MPIWLTWLLQLKEKVIPAFEELHGPEYQALIMVDNLQGHSAYATDALLVSWMNMRPGRKQAHMWDGWFISGGETVVQLMAFPQDTLSFQIC